MNIIERIKKWWLDINTPYERKLYKYTFEITMCDTGEKQVIESNKYYAETFKDFLKFEVFDEKCIKVEDKIINTKCIKDCKLLKTEEITFYYFDERDLIQYCMWGSTKEQIIKHNNEIMGGRNEKY